MYKTCLIIAPLTPVPTLAPNTMTPGFVNTHVLAAMDTSLIPEMDMTLVWETSLIVLGM
jgi:cytosine/adenosine deaminase-related metal-dependent hydrolase